MKTYSPKPEHIERRWYVIDAGDAVLGRVASEAAALLRGKHKPIFAPHMDTGDHVIIVNADKVVLTGDKLEKKIDYRHSGYPGGIRATSYDRLMAERPVYAVEKAVRGMLPKNRLGRAMIRKLHVVPGPNHPHGPQKPEAHALGERPGWDGLPVPTLKTRHAVPEEPAEEPTGPPKKRSSAPKSPAKKATARKTTARSPAKKTTTRKPSAAKATAKKTTAKRTSAPKPAAKESTATKAAETTETSEE